MSESQRRPFYSDFAWAFDLLIDRPVRKESAAIAAWLVERGIVPGAKILDAGCGTGRYAIELARRGYLVHGIDLSPELIEIASDRPERPTAGVSFAVGDLTVLQRAQYAAILCRGVLNDVIEDEARDAAVGAFAGALQSAGVLILDVREWRASADRKAREPLFRKRVATDRGELTFTSVTALDRERRLLLTSERHELAGNGEERVSEYQFVMRCWERKELTALLDKHGFGDVRYFGAYDAAVAAAGATDRLVAVARRSSAGDRRARRGRGHAAASWR
jgi:SAM-dependent methyltransferase